MSDLLIIPPAFSVLSSNIYVLEDSCIIGLLIFSKCFKFIKIQSGSENGG